MSSLSLSIYLSLSLSIYIYIYMYIHTYTIIRMALHCVASCRYTVSRYPASPPGSRRSGGIYYSPPLGCAAGFCKRCVVGGPEVMDAGILLSVLSWTRAVCRNQDAWGLRRCHKPSSLAGPLGPVGDPRLYTYIYIYIYTYVYTYK